MTPLSAAGLDQTTTRQLPCNGLFWLAAIGLGAGASLASAQIAFTDVTAMSGVALTSDTYGASWGDLSDDG